MSGFSRLSSESFESSACNIVLVGSASSADQDFVCKENLDWECDYGFMIVF